ncbi:hypothetical protein JW935_15855 [candidate division KSB1 bacterium]|nr:hypothetical protein [candidate division KSB1 bacterium]
MISDIQYLADVGIIRVSWTGPFVGARDAPGMMKQVRSLAEEHNCNRLLLDFRSTEFPRSLFSTFETGSKAEDLGFDRKFQAAFLYSQDEERVLFIETVMINRGYIVKAVREENEAIAWLTGTSDS